VGATDSASTSCKRAHKKTCAKKSHYSIFEIVPHFQMKMIPCTTERGQRPTRSREYANRPPVARISFTAQSTQNFRSRPPAPTNRTQHRSCAQCRTYESRPVQKARVSGSRTSRVPPEPGPLATLGEPGIQRPRSLASEHSRPATSAIKPRVCAPRHPCLVLEKKKVFQAIRRKHQASCVATSRVRQRIS
jgi:hypothetical protein